MDGCSIDTGKERKDNSGIDLSSTVDGRNPKQSPGMYKTLVNNGINYQPQLVFVAPDFSHQQWLVIVSCRIKVLDAKGICFTI